MEWLESLGVRASTMDTLSCLSVFVVHQNIFCLHRDTFVNSKLVNILTKLIVLTIIVIIVMFGVRDVIASRETFLSGFTSFLLIEHFLLIIGAWKSKASFEMLRSLDRFCGMDAQYYNRMSTKALMATVVSCLLVCVDAVNVVSLPRVTPAMAFCMWAAFSAHNSDLILYGLFIEGINIRLGRLEHMSPSRGRIQYAYIINGCECLNFFFYVRVFIIIVVIFISTLVYLLIALLSDASMLNELIAIIMTRELISIGCLLYVCDAAARSNHLCDIVTFRLARKCTLPSTFMDRNGKELSVADRARACELLSCMNEWRPMYLAGQSVVLNLITPIDLLDASATYILVLIQLYIDYM